MAGRLHGVGGLKFYEGRNRPTFKRNEQSMTLDGKTHIRLDDSNAQDGVRSASIDIPGDKPRVLRFESEDGCLPTEAGADPFVLGALLLLMTAGYPVHVHGSVSARCLWNITELQHIWARWKPDSYSRIEISADAVTPGFPATQGAIAAFSGGVDACYTVQRHLDTGAAMGVGLEAALFIHGFDIPASDGGMFRLARQRGEAILEGTGVRTVGVKTNFKSLGQDWEDSFGLGVASCLSLFQSQYSVGLIGSGSAYESLKLRWGSSPITDYLFSTGQMEFRHDGAGASRTEKVASVSSWPAAARGLRVCWEGQSPDRNCGRCEKCIRTYLNFKAAGVDNPSCFESSPSSSDIRWMRAGTATRLYGIQEILEYAELHGRSGTWLRDLRFAVRLNRAKVAINKVPLLASILEPLKIGIRRITTSTS